MRLPHPSKLPPPPELGEKTIWDYLPRGTARRIFFLLIALGAVIVLKYSGRWSLGGLMDAPRTAPPGSAGAPVYHIKVTRPPDAPKSTP